MGLADPFMVIGKKLFFFKINTAPILFKCSVTLFIGLDERDLSPTSLVLILFVDKSPVISLMLVPEFPKFNSFLGSNKVPGGNPKIIYFPSIFLILDPNCLITLTVFKTSSDSNRLVTLLLPTA